MKQNHRGAQADPSAGSSNTSTQRSAALILLRVFIVAIFIFAAATVALLRSVDDATTVHQSNEVQFLTKLLGDTSEPPWQLRNQQQQQQQQQQYARPAPRNAFEEHYLSIYRSMMIQKAVPPKYMVFRMSSHGLGNKIRTLSGAMFLAAILDRVLLIDSEVVANLFEPPMLDGVILDWNITLVNGLCDTSDEATTHTINMAIKRSEYMPHFVNFHDKYSSITCLVAGSSFGHDRQVATLNEQTYKAKVERLFGHATSRFIWSKATMSLIMQRPRQDFVDAGREKMVMLGLDKVPFENRMTVHFRTFTDLAQESHKEIFDARTKFWKCVVPMVGDLIEEQKRTVDAGKVSILFVSDNQEIKDEAKEKLGTIDGANIIDAGLSFVHTSGTDDTDAFLEWFLVGECATVISTGYSSYGITAYFRPSIFPPADADAKHLFTVDGLSKSFFANNRNNPCGEVVASGYGDINIGFYDPLYRPDQVALALKNAETMAASAVGKASSKTLGSDQVALRNAKTITGSVPAK